ATAPCPQIRPASARSRTLFIPRILVKPFAGSAAMYHRLSAAGQRSAGPLWPAASRRKAAARNLAPAPRGGRRVTARADSQQKRRERPLAAPTRSNSTENGQHADHHRKERGAFEHGRGNQRDRVDLTRRLRLTRHRLGRAAA